MSHRHLRLLPFLDLSGICHSGNFLVVMSVEWWWTLFLEWQETLHWEIASVLALCVVKSSWNLRIWSFTRLSSMLVTNSHSLSSFSFSTSNQFICYRIYLFQVYIIQSRHLYIITNKFKGWLILMKVVIRMNISNYDG